MKLQKRLHMFYIFDWSSFTLNSVREVNPLSYHNRPKLTAIRFTNSPYAVISMRGKREVRISANVHWNSES